MPVIGTVDVVSITIKHNYEIYGCAAHVGRVLTQMVTVEVQTF